MVITLSLIIGLSCGKVTQEVDKKAAKKPTSFTLDYSVTILSTTNVFESRDGTPILSTSNIFTLGRPTLYSAVYGIGSQHFGIRV